MTTWGQPRHRWAAVVRRQSARRVEGRPEGDYTDAFEITCCYCGDHSYLDYCEVSSELQRVRGPYPITDGIAAYEEHLGRHHDPARATSMARGRILADWR